MIAVDFKEAFEGSAESSASQAAEEPTPQAKVEPVNPKLSHAIAYLHIRSGVSPDTLLSIYQGLRNAAQLARNIAERTGYDTNSDEALGKVVRELSFAQMPLQGRDPECADALFHVLNMSPGEPAEELLIHLAEILTDQGAEMTARAGNPMPKAPAAPPRLNPPEQLAPVNCPLLIEVDGKLVRAERTRFLESKVREMSYRLECGTIIEGKYRWTYP